MRAAATDDTLWPRLAGGISRPPSEEEIADSYLALFDKLQGARVQPSEAKPPKRQPTRRGRTSSAKARA